MCQGRRDASSSPSEYSFLSTEPASLSNATSASSLPNCVSWEAFWNDALTCSVDHPQFHDHVCEIVGASGDSALDVCNKYFRLIHHWLPIVPRHTAYEPLTELGTVVPAEISLLLLCMHLINQVPSHGSQWSEQQKTLYVVTKTTHAQAQSILPASSELVQAGLLIATYEHSHGLRDAAYLSLGSCFRTAHVLGLHKAHNNARTSIKQAEDWNLWWGCIAREK